MSDRKLGFVGCGRLGQSLLRGWLDANVLQPDQVFIAAKTSGEATAASFGARVSNVPSIFEQCDTIILAVKPYQFTDAVKGVQCPPDRLIISTMAGVPVDVIRRRLPGSQIVRTMPNVACRVSRGVTLCYAPQGVHSDAMARVSALFGCVGLVESLPSEDYFHAGTGLSGSGPAYIFTAIQAMADGGVAAGLSRDAALRLAIATTEGAAALLRISGEHPEALKDSVASPNGTTVAGLRVLERRGVRSAFCDGIVAAAERSKEMAREAGKA